MLIEEWKVIKKSRDQVKKAEFYLRAAHELNQSKKRKNRYLAKVFLRKALYIFNLYGDNDKIKIIKTMLKKERTDEKAN